MSLQVKIWQVLVIFFTAYKHSSVNCEGHPTLKSFSSTNLRTLAVNISNSDEMFSQLLKPMLIVRVPDTEGNLKVQNHIKSHMSNFGWTVEDDPFEDMTPLGSKKFNNIIATHNPGAKKRLIFACHFDSKLFNFKFVGATDSAVPCAIMLDIAKQLSCFMDRKRDEADDVTLQFVFFDGEEAFQSWSDTDSIYGARHLATKWSGENDPNVENKNKLETIHLNFKGVNGHMSILSLLAYLWGPKLKPWISPCLLLYHLKDENFMNLTQQMQLPVNKFFESTRNTNVLRYGSKKGSRTES